MISLLIPRHAYGSALCAAPRAAATPLFAVRDEAPLPQECAAKEAKIEVMRARAICRRARKICASLKEVRADIYGADDARLRAKIAR